MESWWRKVADQRLVTFEGKTQALIFKAKLTEKSNKDAFDAFKAGEEIQNSIRMVYVRMDLAVDSSDKEFKEEKKIWDKYAPLVANKEAQIVVEVKWESNFFSEKRIVVQENIYNWVPQYSNNNGNGN